MNGTRIHTSTETNIAVVLGMLAMTASFLLPSAANAVGCARFNVPLDTFSLLRSFRRRMRL